MLTKSQCSVKAPGAMSPPALPPLRCAFKPDHNNQSMIVAQAVCVEVYECQLLSARVRPLKYRLRK
jgi:hypothetical protein